MSQFDVEIQLDCDLSDPVNTLLVKTARAALLHQRAQGPAALTILLTDDARIRELNRDFLGYDQPTDVLAFPVGAQMPGSQNYLGDVAISVETAARQAESAGHSLDVELQLLVVHALLHLLGHDHVAAQEKQAMWSAQTTILAQLGVVVGEPVSN